jgi:hypothetical protein
LELGIRNWGKVEVEVEVEVKDGDKVEVDFFHYPNATKHRGKPAHKFRRGSHLVNMK